MDLDPQVQVLLDEMNAIEAPPPWERPIAEVRADFDAMVRERAAPGPDVARVADHEAPGPHGPVPVRVFWPDGIDDGGGPLPVLVYIHGSGFVLLRHDNYDHVCRALCQGAGCIVASVDYRKAPENKFPVAADDAWAATRWVAENCAALGGDPARIAVAGDSSGGCLAAVMAQKAKAEGGPALVFQLLVYPVTDMRDDTDSYRDFAEGYSLSADMMRWFMDCYLNDEADKADLAASPLRSADMSGLPPALVLTASHDPLLDDGRDYAERLRAAGVPAEHFDYQGFIHGFWSATARIDAAAEAHARACAALRGAFGTVKAARLRSPIP